MKTVYKNQLSQIEQAILDEDTKIRLKQQQDSKHLKEIAGNIKILEGDQMDDYWKHKVVASLKKAGGPSKLITNYMS